MLGGILTGGIGLALCGCTTTQTTAARLQLNDDRLRALSIPVRVDADHVDSSVSVVAKTVLARRGGYTAVVTLTNHASQAVSDLPISVGYVAGSRTVYLNAAANQKSYFDNHIPSIAAHGTLTWVGSGVAKQAVPAHARIFARVGRTPSADVGVFTPPTMTISQPAGTGLAVRVRNPSSITQYQLPVYAVAMKGGRVLAASTRSIADLGGGDRAVVHLKLADPDASAAGASVQVEAPATIFK